MPVVINEFEVVTEPDRPHGPSASSSVTEPPRPTTDIERVLADQRARARRVRAY